MCFHKKSGRIKGMEQDLSHHIFLFIYFRIAYNTCSRFWECGFSEVKKGTKSIFYFENDEISRKILRKAGIFLQKRKLTTTTS